MAPAAHIVAKLAANAATHSCVPGRDFRLTLYVVGDTLRIEVTDGVGRVQSRSATGTRLPVLRCEGRTFPSAMTVRKNPAGREEP
ncbi:hypothetical protein CA983_30505 [Streptomyces swartbergensis]|uniref:ATP-binding protein n=1 Tax=Streptomyces swartbergensis TaxID=487165 RepID=A0A243RR72_9ACTN|nr:hypothetical protein CA983_30505 [Streptomyces swartbergensis]